MSISPAIVEAAEGAGLTYVTDSAPGITRHRAGSGFFYRYPDGSKVVDRYELDRIRKLAIPPAYRNVWICLDPNGHLQATGIDARGRKQYRYNLRFREVQEENKFKRMIRFGEVLPELRERVSRDLASHKLAKEKVLAAVVALLDKSLIRVGNEEYAKENKSFGLTTLRNRHVKIAGSKIEFNFLGKSKIKHRIEINDARLARVIKRLQELPGQELFQYLDDSGSRVSVTSADVNAYLQEITGEHFTAKDFRTWWGTLLALVEFSNLELPGTKVGAKRAVTSVMTAVSKQLGNTPSICRKCYVHPVVVGAFERGSLTSLLDEAEPGVETVQDLVSCAETTLIELLRKHELESAQPPQAA